MLARVCIFVTVAQLILSTANGGVLKDEKAYDDQWWKSAVFYQIYPRSYKDDNNDGIGDLKGITSKLSYLQQTGIKATWLSPIYKSPQVDQGYDISDYKDIEPDYGTLKDFDELIKAAKELGIKIIMDLVPNHSSDQHVWFKLSENRTKGYEDYYVWADKNKTTGKEPNNWISVFKYSAWTWSDIRKQYYFHQFAPQQPDLNFRNPAVHQEMLDVMKFWMDRGVAGFRIDAVPHVFETGMEDEPRSNDPNAKPHEHGYLNHIYTTDQNETFELVYKWRDFVDAYSKGKGDYQRVLMIEAYTSMENSIRYYGDQKNNRLGAHFSFNFHLFGLNINSSAHDAANIINNWMSKLPKEYVSNWVLGNHDNPRVATRFGPENVDAYNMLISFLPGIGVYYNGEEIGQENGYVSYEEGQDPGACNGGPEEFAKNSRDFERTPFHWDNSTNAGFNVGKKPWLPVSDKYKETNVARQNVNGLRTHYNIYKDLMKLRKENTWLNSDFTAGAASDAVLYLIRSLKGEKTYAFVFNKKEKVETVDLSKVISSKDVWKVVLASVNSSRKIGEIVTPEKLVINPHESIIISA